MNQINQINQLTSVNTLKLSHAAVQPKTDGSTFAGLMKEELNKTEGLRFSTGWRVHRKCSAQSGCDHDEWYRNERKYIYKY